MLKVMSSMWVISLVVVNVNPTQTKSLHLKTRKSQRQKTSTKSPVEMGPKNGGLGGKMGVETLDFGFATRKRHFLARNRVVCSILRQNRCTRLGCSLSQEPKKVAESL